MNGPSFDTSVIICAYTEERWDDLVAAIESVQHQTVAAREIIVSVDHNPALMDRVRQRFPDVIVTENHTERGLSGARNSGIDEARGTLIAFLDDDATAEPDWLERLQAGYRNPNVIGVGGKILPLWAGGKPGWFPEEFNWVVGCSYRGLPETPAPVRNLIGCNMSFRRDVFNAIGGFRNGIGRVGTRPVGCEETELCIRAHNQWPMGVMLYEPGAAVHHRVTPNRTRWTYFRQRCFAEGISKALVASLVGPQQGLASERTHTLRTLPVGVIRGVADSLKGDLDGIRRSAAIVAGLVTTTAGYLYGRMALRSRPASPPATRPTIAEAGARAQ